MDAFYPIVVLRLPESEGGLYMGYAPDLRGCMSHGDTPAEAVANAQQAVSEWIGEAKELGRPIPLPGSCTERLREERERLLQTVKEQSQAADSLKVEFQKIETEVEALRAAYTAVTESIVDLPMWGPVLHLGRNNGPEEIIH